MNMKHDPKLQFKMETGMSPYVEIETKRLSYYLDADEFRGYSAKEIMSFIEHDMKHNASWGVFVKDLPKEYLDGEDLKIISPQYVEWLEEKG